jgi:hypothetical protein
MVKSVIFGALLASDNSKQVTGEEAARTG